MKHHAVQPRWLTKPAFWAGLRAGIQPMLLKLAVGAPETQPSPILGGRVMTPGSLRYGRTSRTSLAIIPWRGRLKVLRTKRSRGIGAQSEPMAWRGWLSCLVLGILLCCCSTSSAGRRNMAPSTNPSATGAQPALTTSSSTSPEPDYGVTAARLMGPGLGVVATFAHIGVPALWRTQDWSHWENITPAQTDQVIADVAYQAGTIWALGTECANGSSTDTVWRSTTGGRTWTSASLPGAVCEAASVTTLDFVDALHGWVAEMEPTGPVGYLYASDDGGRSWHPQGRRLPELGAVGFYTPKDGYLGGAQGVDWATPTAYVTHDGGVSWARVPLRLPDLPSWQSLVGLASFTSALHGVLPVTFDKANTEQVGWYVTDDGGRTWTLRAPTRPVGLIEGNVHYLQVADTSVAGPETWWVLARDQGNWSFQVTVDGGATWTTHVLTPRWPNEADLMAVSATTAWVRTGIGALFGTHDGGLSGSVFTP